MHWDTKIKEVRGSFGQWELACRPDDNRSQPATWQWSVSRSGCTAKGAGQVKTREQAQHVAEEVAAKLASAFGGADAGARAKWIEVPEAASGILGHWKLEVAPSGPAFSWAVYREGCHGSATGRSTDADGIAGAMSEAEAAARALASVFGE